MNYLSVEPGPRSVHKHVTLGLVAEPSVRAEPACRCEHADKIQQLFDIVIQGVDIDRSMNFDLII